uniref:Retroviral polymerase SH3-like domain-containing protein n=1 Tax=Tanacetum cinerariifolium TaxID=118510 RepID=A0A6L2MGM8_TANCI|nr:hypothetical protein [Tanacetum cinerariifolium]
MGELTFFFGLQVKQKKDGIFISQDKYVAEILRKFGLSEGKSASTPIDVEKPLLKDSDGEDVDVHTYRSMIGSLIKSDISFLHVFGALCYPKNDREDIGKLGAKGDIGFFIGYSADSCVYRIYNRRTKKIMETMNVSFDELSALAFKQHSSKPGLQSMTSRQISSGLDLTYAPSTITKQQPNKGKLDLLFEAMYDDYFGGQPSAIVENVPPAQEPQVRQTSTAYTTIADNVPIPTNSSSHATNIPITS